MFEAFLLITALVLALVAINFVHRLTNTVDKQFYRSKWREIEKMMRESQVGAHQAIIEADKLLDFALKQLNFSGATMADRLKSARPSLSKNDNVWRAHKLRNNLVHETDHKTKLADIKRALSSYQRALKDLRVL